MLSKFLVAFLEVELFSKLDFKIYNYSVYELTQSILLLLYQKNLLEFLFCKTGFTLCEIL